MHDITPDAGPTALLEAAARGDQEAFAALYDLLAPRALGLVLRVLRDRAQAEEVLQEVFLQVWEQAPRFDPAKGSALSWVFSLAHRRAVDRVRSEQARSDRQVVYESRVDPAPVDAPGEELLQREDARSVHSALSQLTTAQREAVELAYLQGLTHSQVADRLDVPLGTAKSRIRDGLLALRRTMDRRSLDGGER